MKVHLAATLLLSLCLGALAGFYAGSYRSCTVLTVNVRHLAEEKKQEIIQEFEKSGGSNTSTLEEEYKQFLLSLDALLDDYTEGKNVILLRREAVVAGNYVDITDELRKKLAEVGRTGGKR